MKQVPSVGRIVHIYGPLWSGPRPGIIVSVSPAPMTSGDYFANVNVFLDGTTDREPLAACRQSAIGNTLPELFINEPLDATTRQGLLEQAKASGDTTFRWAEWPPIVVPRPMPHFSQANGAELGDGPAIKPPDGLRPATSKPVIPAQDDDGDCD